MHGACLPPRGGADVESAPVRLPGPLVLPVLLAGIALAAAGCGGSAETSPEGVVPFDRAFIDGMVPHHEAAIEMAKAATEAGLSSPELAEVADAVVETQQVEIDKMRAWREEWFGSRDIDPDGAAALGLSETELGMQHDAGSVADADDVDAAFASMMIDHHRGAIRMARLALERAGHEEIRTLAAAIVEAQEAEIAVLGPHVAADHGGHGG